MKGNDPLDPVCGRCDLAVAGVQSLACPGCEAVYHQLCAAKLGHCAAIGCDRDLLRPPTHPAWPYLRSLAYAAAIVVAVALLWRTPVQGSSAAPAADDLLAQPGSPARALLEVPREITRLRNADPAERRRAAEALAALGPGAAEAEPRLAGALEHERDPQVRAAVCAALGSLEEAGGETARRAVRACLTNDDPVVRAAAATALARLRDSAASAPLIAALTDDDPRVATAAARALGTIDDRSPAAVAGLQAALARAPLRPAAVDALGRLGPAARVALPSLLSHLGRRETSAPDPLAPALLRAIGQIAFGAAPGPLTKPGPVIAALQRGLNDPTPAVQIAAAQAVADAGPLSAPIVPVVATLVDLLTDAQQPTPLRRVVAQALERLRLGTDGPRVLALRRLLQERTHLFEIRAALAVIGRSGPAGRSAIPEIVAWGQRRYGVMAVQALANLPPSRATTRALAEVLAGTATGPAGRRAALRALRDLGPRARPALTEVEHFAQRGPITHRAEALTILGAIPDPAAVAALSAALSDPSAELRRRAADGLHAQAGRAKPALPALRALRADPDAQVAQAALRAATEIESYR